MNHDVHPEPASTLSAVLRAVVTTIALLAWLTVGAWVIGRVASDRYLWSQWLLWLPTPGVLLACLIGWVCAWRPRRAKRRRRTRITAWSIALLLIAAYFMMFEHHVIVGPRSIADAGGVRIVHWTMSHGKNEREALAERALAYQGDLTILLEGYGVQRTDTVREAVESGMQSIRRGPFILISRLPIIEFRSIAASDRINLALLRIDASSRMGRELRLVLVDLPSEPFRSRWDIAVQARSFLESLDAPPDIVVGDFNMTRHSRAMRELFPDHHHAYEDAGRGYAATYHRTLPLYHIDHVLLSGEFTATMYAVYDPDEGRHCVQVAQVVPQRIDQADPD